MGSGNQFENQCGVEAARAVVTGVEGVWGVVGVVGDGFTLGTEMTDMMPSLLDVFHKLQFRHYPHSQSESIRESDQLSLY